MAKAKETIDIPNVTWEWQYALVPDGFETKVSHVLSEHETLVITNVLPWDVFIQGLAIGWEKYHQDDPESAHAIIRFIQKLVSEGKLRR